MQSTVVSSAQRQRKTFKVPAGFTLAAVVAAYETETAVFLNGNTSDGVSILGIGEHQKITLTTDNPWERLQQSIHTSKDWWLGYLSYDLKNTVEALTSENQDQLHFPLGMFVCPRLLFRQENDQVTVHFHEALSEDEWKQLTAVFEGDFQIKSSQKQTRKLVARENEASYLRKIEALQNHIQQGDIYEVNYCQEFYEENATLDAFETYLSLNDRTNAPFSVYLKEGDKHLLCGSPERFIQKRGNTLTSQPIKGTTRRGKNEEEDQALIEALRNSPKEQGENVMIVDLVRNDLSKVAQRGSVKVEELFGIYSFRTVHQMISTVVAKLKPEYSGVDAIKAAFPMGSMTGAPKVRAMELIEQYEETKRGLYSGAVGYFTPEGDFDFNVVIRSILYNAMNRYLSVMVGGAITAKSDPQSEYEECMVKAKAMFEALQATLDTST